MDDLQFDRIFGWFALAFGLFVGALYLRMAFTGRTSSLLGKLEPMQARFGRVPGTVIHLVGYCLLPLALGLLLITQE